MASPIELGLTRNWPEWFQRDPALKRIAAEDGGTTTTAGANVNAWTATNFSAVWSAVLQIAGSIGSMPCGQYEKQEDGTSKLLDSAQTWLVREEPNPTCVPFTFFETLVNHAVTTGGGYAEIVRNNAGTPAELWLADPFKITPEKQGKTLVYTQTGAKPVPAADMIHVPGLGWDGIRGYSVVSKAREAIGAGLAMESYGSAYFGNGTTLGVVLEHPGRLSPEAQGRLVDSFERRHQGSKKAFRPFVAEENMKAKSIAFPNKDAEFLASREFQIEEIARWFNIPLTKLKSKAGERPGGNIEAQNIEFVVDCLRPWLVRIEQELNRKLVPMRNRPRTFFKFTVEALLRGDSGTEANAFKVYFDMGVIDAEYIAQKKDFPKPKPKPEPPPPPAPIVVEEVKAAPDAEEKEAARAAIRTLVMDSMDRLVRIETNEARRNAGKLEAWAAEFYPKHRARLVALLEPAQRLVSPLAQDSRAKAEALADALCEAHRAALSDPLMLERWEKECPADVADRVLGGRA